MPPMSVRTKLSVTDCYALAWRSFSKWWIPLCLISGVLLVCQVVPRIVTRTETSGLKASVREVIAAVQAGDIDTVARLSERVSSQAFAMVQRVLALATYALPAVALVTVVLLMVANWAVRDERGKRPPAARLVIIAVVHVVLAVVKALVFVIMFPLGVYIYIKLLFVSLIMLEEKSRAVDAIRASWRMTEGHFWRLLLLVLMNIGLQVLALPTVIGEIPVTGFANTARAAAYRMLKQQSTGNRQGPQRRGMRTGDGTVAMPPALPANSKRVG